MTTYQRYLEVRQQEAVTVVRFKEHRIYDDLVVKRITDALHDLTRQTDCQHLLLSLAGVVSPSSLLIGNLVVILSRMEKKGGKLRLCDVGPEIRRMFGVMRLDSLFDIRESEADGLLAFAETGASSRQQESCVPQRLTGPKRKTCVARRNKDRSYPD